MGAGGCARECRHVEVVRARRTRGDELEADRSPFEPFSGFAADRELVRSCTALQEMRSLTEDQSGFCQGSRERGKIGRSDSPSKKGKVHNLSLAD